MVRSNAKAKAKKLIRQSLEEHKVHGGYRPYYAPEAPKGKRVRSRKKKVITNKWTPELIAEFIRCEENK